MHIFEFPLQGKDPIAEVIKEVFSVIKLAKIVKKTFSTTFIFGNGGFGGDFNGIWKKLKILGGWRSLRMFFSLVRY